MAEYDLDLDTMHQQLDEVARHAGGDLPKDCVLALGAYRLALDNHVGGVIDPEPFFFLASDLCPDEHRPDMFFEMLENGLITQELHDKALARLVRQLNTIPTH